MNDEHESEMKEYRPARAHFVLEFWVIFILFGFFAVIYFLMAETEAAKGHKDNAVALYIRVYIVIIIMIILLIWSKMRSTVLRLEKHDMLVTESVVLWRWSKRIPYVAITRVRAWRGPVSRLIGTGHVSLKTGMTFFPIRLKGYPEYEEIAQEIKERVERQKLRLGGTG